MNPSELLFSGCMPSSGITGSYGSSIILVLGGPATLFSVVTTPMSIPAKSVGEFPCRHTLSSFCCLQSEDNLFWNSLSELPTLQGHTPQTASGPWIFPHPCSRWAPDSPLLSDAGRPRPRTLCSFSLFKPISKHVSSLVGAFLHVPLSQAESTTWSINRVLESARMQ